MTKSSVNSLKLKDSEGEGGGNKSSFSLKKKMTVSSKKAMDALEKLK
jgi:hypothetical protein